MTLGQTIRSMRKRRGETGTAFGARLGVQHNTISQYETGTAKPSLAVMFHLHAIAADDEKAELARFVDKSVFAAVAGTAPNPEVCRLCHAPVGAAAAGMCDAHWGKVRGWVKEGLLWWTGNTGQSHGLGLDLWVLAVRDAQEGEARQ